MLCVRLESNNLDTLTIDELQSRLLVHEQRMNGYQRDEQALKVTYDNRFGGRRGNQGRGSFQGRGKEIGNQAFKKAIIKCYKCHQLGNFQYECPEWEKKQTILSLRRNKRCC